MYSVVIFCHIASLNGSILSLKKNSLVEISHIIIDFFIIPVPVILNQIQFCLETSLIVTTWVRLGVATDIWWVEARAGAKHPTMHRTAHSPPKELWSQMSIALRLRNSVIMCHTMVARIKTVMGRGGEVLRFWIYF